MTGRPAVWLLDVDGTINCTRPGPAWGPGPPRRHSVWVPSVRQLLRIRWAPALTDQLRAAHTEGHVELRWCTSWCTDAHVLERLWGLPRLVRAIADTDVSGGGQRCAAAKLRAAHTVVDSGRRLIWTDDDAIPASGPDHDRLLGSGRALLHAPHPRCGLQPDQMAAIAAFSQAPDLPGRFIGPPPRRRPTSEESTST